MRERERHRKSLCVSETGRKREERGAREVHTVQYCVALGYLGSNVVGKGW